MKKNTEQGKSFEDWLVNYFFKLGDVPRKTRNSGGVTSEPDIITPNCSIEAKRTESESFTVSESMYDKLCRDTNREGIKVLATRIKNNKVLFTISSSDFALLYRLFLTSTNSKKDIASNAKLIGK